MKTKTCRLIKGCDGESPDTKKEKKNQNKRKKKHHSLVSAPSVLKSLLEGRDRWKIWPWLYEIKWVTMSWEQLPHSVPQCCFSELFATRQLLVPSCGFATKGTVPIYGAGRGRRGCSSLFWGLTVPKYKTLPLKEFTVLCFILLCSLSFHTISNTIRSVLCT